MSLVFDLRPSWLLVWLGSYRMSKRKLSAVTERAVTRSASSVAKEPSHSRQKEPRSESMVSLRQHFPLLPQLPDVTIGDGISNYFSDHEKMAKTVGTLTAIAIGIYTAKVGTGIAGRFIESRLGKPVLVRETSKRTILDAFREPTVTMKRIASSIMKKTDTNALRGVVLEEGLAERLRSVAVSFLFLFIFFFQ